MLKAIDKTVDTMQLIAGSAASMFAMGLISIASDPSAAASINGVTCVHARFVHVSRRQPRIDVVPLMAAAHDLPRATEPSRITSRTASVTSITSTSWAEPRSLEQRSGSVKREAWAQGNTRHRQSVALFEHGGEAAQSGGTTAHTPHWECAAVCLFAKKVARV